MKTEAPNKASSRHQTQRRTQAYDVLAQPPEVAQGLGEIQVPIMEPICKRPQAREEGWTSQVGRQSQGSSQDSIGVTPRAS